jgi:opacity protein-like surface antigen
LRAPLRRDRLIEYRAGREVVTTLLIAAVLVVTLSIARPATAFDGDAVRGYLGIRLGAAVVVDTDVRPGVEAMSRIEQLTGVTVGFNLSRHLGVEIAADGYELNLGVPGLPRGKTVGEYAIYTVVPQLRVRYPMLGDRLTPYAIAGIGVGYNEFNDTKEPVFRFDLDVGGETFGAVGALGAGVEYFVANNIAVGVETKYLLSRWHEIRLQGSDRASTLDSVLFTIGLRLLYP